MAAAAPVAATLGLPACNVATLVGPISWRIGLEQLQQALDGRLPLVRPVPPVLDAAVAAARVQLLPQEQRFAAELDYTVAERLTQRRFGGLLAVDFVLRLVLPPGGRDGALQLAQARVSRLAVQGVPQYMLAPLRPALDALVAQAIEGLAIYRITPDEQARLARYGYRIEGVQVLADAVLVKLVPG